MEYSTFLNELKTYAEKDFAKFQRKLIPTQQTILGVRTPTMRKLAKKYQAEYKDIFSFPDDYFEVTFIKLAQIAVLPYTQFIQYVEACVDKIDNWAICDCFKAKCLFKQKTDFIPILEKLFVNKGEFYQRYVLVVLLSTYIEEGYLPLIESFLKRADKTKYYVYMAAAWLTAEVLVKHYDYGVQWLQTKILDVKTHNKAIQKARESYRLSKEQKGFLKSLKIKQ